MAPMAPPVPSPMVPWMMEGLDRPSDTDISPQLSGKLAVPNSGTQAIGVVRVFRLGEGKCKSCLTGPTQGIWPTYPLSKTENSSDLVHYFLGGA